jgi:hypothetical protein
VIDQKREESIELKSETELDSFVGRPSTSMKKVQGEDATHQSLEIQENSTVRERIIAEISHLKSNFKALDSFGKRLGPQCIRSVTATKEIEQRETHTN